MMANIRTQGVVVGTLVLMAITILSGAAWRSRDRFGMDFATSNSTSSKSTFYEIAQKHGTDKVTTHSYQHMYSKHLTALRNTHFKMLEIGLGCNMDYGPGASFYTWLEYFPHVDLYFIEYDASCAEKWAANTTLATIFSGDQADTDFLADFMQKSGSGFDVIIDDGGHRMNQQITSLEVLFDAVNPGGVYFCEDLQTSYDPGYGGGKDAEVTMMKMIQGILDDLHAKKVPSGAVPLKHDVSRNMQSVECMEEICAFFKKEL